MQINKQTPTGRNGKPKHYARDHHAAVVSDLNQQGNRTSVATLFRDNDGNEYNIKLNALEIDWLYEQLYKR